MTDLKQIQREEATLTIWGFLTFEISAGNLTMTDARDIIEQVAGFITEELDTDDQE